MPAYVNALTGEGVHIITVNEYLAERDANWMGNIYLLRVNGCVNHRELTPNEKRKLILRIFFIRLIMKLVLTIYVIIWSLKLKIEFNDH